MAACRRVSASAPGKVIVHGEHAAVWGQPALAASLGLRTTLTLQEERASEPELVLQFPCVGVEARFAMRRVAERLLLPARPLRAWARPRDVQHERLLAAVDGFVAGEAAGADGAGEAHAHDSVRALLYLAAGVLADEAPRHSLRARVTSELAVGAGAGSSAALAVCAAAALLALRGAAAAAADPELVSAWAYNCERITHGAPSGVDNTTCTLGGVVRFRAGTAARPMRLARALRVLLVHSGVGRSTAALVRRVAERRDSDPRAVDAVLAACGHVTDSAAQILERLPGDGGGDADADAHYRRLAELWDMNHCLLAALGVSHPALEDIRQRAARHQLAAKLTGAGGGGYAIVLVPPSAAESAVSALSEELRGAGYHVTDTLLGGDGVTLHCA